MDAAQREGLAERFQYLAGHHAGPVVVVLMGEQHGELVAAQTRHDVFVPHMATDALCDSDQQFVARIMAESVVDMLEAVEVDEQQSHPRLVAFDVPQRLFQTVAEHAAVFQTCQRIEVGQFLQLGVQFALLTGVFDAQHDMRERLPVVHDGRSGHGLPVALAVAAGAAHRGGPHFPPGDAFAQGAVLLVQGGIAVHQFAERAQQGVMADAGDLGVAGIDVFDAAKCVGDHDGAMALLHGTGQQTHRLIGQMLARQHVQAETHRDEHQPRGDGFGKQDGVAVLRQCCAVGKPDAGQRGCERDRAHQQRQQTIVTFGESAATDSTHTTPLNTAYCRLRNSRSAFLVWRRFSASSHTTALGASSTLAVTSSPRWAGRQCMNKALLLACDSSSSLI